MNKKLLTFSLLPFLLNGCWDTDKGQQLGIVTGVKKEGVFIHTGAAYIQTGFNSLKANKYCVDKEDIYKKLESASLSQKSITIYSHKEWLIGFWRCEDEQNIIDDVKFQGEK